MEQKAIPIGVEFYKDIVDKPYYYIDKTLLVKELIDKSSKVVKRYQDMKTGCDTAIHQLEKRDYAAHWRNEGYTDIIQYGICFYKKECMIKICK